MGLTLDSGALIAYERGDPRVRAFLRAAARQDVPPTVPTVVVAETWRTGSTQARIARLLRDSLVEPLDEGLAKRAGELQARTGTDDPIDAVVAQSAAQRGDLVLTSDVADVHRLADDLRTIRVKAI